MRPHDPAALAMAIHPRDRMLRQPAALFAGLLPGAAGAQNGYGIGDCLLIDAARGIYAVADASERCPEASRRLLRRFHDALGGGAPPPDRIDAAVAAAFGAQPFTARTTFCCIALRADHGRTTIRVYSGGDSLAWITAAPGGGTVYRSAPDMAFAGRSKTAPAGRDVLVDGDGWLAVLATDGWHDVRPRGGGDAAAALAEAVAGGRTPDFERVPGGDDAAWIAVAPGALKRIGAAAPAVVMGGIGALRAASARRRRTGDPPPDAWLPPPDWPSWRQAIENAGIRVIGPSTDGSAEKDTP